MLSRLVSTVVRLSPLLLYLTCGALGQTGAVITGRIVDAERGTPLENVIVFLANTPLGTSTGKDGTYRIENVPPDTYELVFSCVGYQRQILSCSVEKAEALSYSVALIPRPIQTPGIEIRAERSESVLPHPWFFPRSGDHAYTIFGSGSTMPVGIFFADSALYMYSLDTAIVDSEKYIRVWLLYKNLSRTCRDIDPMKCIRLHVQGENFSYKNLLPEPPEKFLRTPESELSRERISEMIGQPLRITNENVNLMLMAELKLLMKYMGSQERQTYWHNPTHGSLSAGSLNPLFQTSVCDGVLQRHLVYPENSVNGYVYIPFPGLHWRATDAGFSEAFECRYTLEIMEQGVSKTIEFTLGGS